MSSCFDAVSVLLFLQLPASPSPTQKVSADMTCKWCSPERKLSAQQAATPAACDLCSIRIGFVSLLHITQPPHEMRDVLNRKMFCSNYIRKKRSQAIMWSGDGSRFRRKTTEIPPLFVTSTVWDICLWQSGTVGIETYGLCIGVTRLCNGPTVELLIHVSQNVLGCFFYFPFTLFCPD